MCIIMYVPTDHSQVMREVGWVIFDEIHYMRDPGTLRVNVTTHTHACIQPPLVVNNHVCASCVFVAHLCNLLCEVFIVVTH